MAVLANASAPRVSALALSCVGMQAGLTRRMERTRVLCLAEWRGGSGKASWARRKLAEVRPGGEASRVSGWATPACLSMSAPEAWVDGRSQWEPGEHKVRPGECDQGIRANAELCPTTATNVSG